ncbi:MAG: SH3 domain-containing protein [Nitrospinaceae bacterium]|jgi:hypothetical protein|nr:SH3 domain-containing protein [Nitrospinaceae bacterium]MDP6735412.1 SH3 domain-containing protein [Nitrospinaceae bacterium]|tara:strand:- start:361 stop:891 length:531 start_codon:yes stop_codon:yes gene_type:complete
MNDSLTGNLRPDGEGSKGDRNVAYCDFCNTQLPPSGLFCPDCGPPLPPGKEPEEIGTTPDQVFLRISAIVILFLAFAFVKLEISFDDLLFWKAGEEAGEMLTDGKRLQDSNFQIIHTVIVPLANVRAKPSTKSKVVTVVEKGMGLDVLEDNGRWSKIQVFGKTGWISNQLLQSEIK